MTYRLVSDELVALRLEGELPPLYCLPAAGGSAGPYLGLAEALPSGRPVLGIQCPGLDDGRVPLTSVHDMAEEYAGLLLADGTGPHHLVGWSMGAAVAFETARGLAAAGARPGALVLVDPPLPQPGTRPEEPEIARRFLADLAGADAVEEQVPARITDLAAAGDGTPMFEELRAVGMIPADVDTEFLVDRYAVFRANVTALVDYTPGGTWAGGATLVKAEHGLDTVSGWRLLVADLRVHPVAADHHAVLSGAALTEVAALTGQVLAEADRSAR